MGRKLVVLKPAAAAYCLPMVQVKLMLPWSVTGLVLRVVIVVALWGFGIWDLIGRDPLGWLIVVFAALLTAFLAFWFVLRMRIRRRPQPEVEAAQPH